VAQHTVAPRGYIFGVGVCQVLLLGQREALRQRVEHLAELERA
jgi:hypothetical protein